MLETHNPLISFCMLHAWQVDAVPYLMTCQNFSAVHCNMAASYCRILDALCCALGSKKLIVLSH